MKGKIMAFEETKEKISNITKQFIKSCKTNKNIEVAFRKYHRAKNDTNELRLLQYLDPYILSMTSTNRKNVLFIFGFIANNIKDVFEKMSMDSFIKTYAIKTKNLKKTDREKLNTKINILLKKSKVNDIKKYLDHNILYEVSNFNFAALIIDLMYFNKNTINFWGTEYYKIVNDITEDEE